MLLVATGCTNRHIDRVNRGIRGLWGHAAVAWVSGYGGNFLYQLIMKGAEMIDMEMVLAYKTQQGYADCHTTIEEHDKEVISKFMSWLCDKYDIVEPEEDEDVLYGYMKHYTKDELLEKYESIK